jgi:WD40 repeat protein
MNSITHALTRTAATFAIFAGLALNSALLWADPPAKLVDNYGDPLPPGAIQRFGTIRFRAGSMIGELCYSPDGKLIAASSEHEILVWERSTGRRLRTLPRRGRDDMLLSFSPDSKQILCIDSDLFFWDLATGRETGRRELNHSNFFFVAISKDLKWGLLESSSEDRSILAMIDLSKPGARPEELIGHSKKLLGAEASPQGNRIASYAEDGTIRIWNANSHESIHVFKAPEGDVSAIAWSPDGKHIASSHGGCSRIIEAESGAEVTRLAHPEDSGGFTQIEFTPDGLRVVATWTGLIYVFDAKTGKELREISLDESLLSRFRVSPDGSEIAAIINGNVIQRFDLETGRVLAPAAMNLRNGKRIAVSSIEKTVNVANKYRVQVWDAGNARELRNQKPESYSGDSPAFSGDARRFASIGPGCIKIWDGQSGAEVRHLRREVTEYYRKVASSFDGRYCAAANEDDQIAMWDTTTGKFLGTALPASYCDCLRFSDDGRFLAASDNIRIEIFDRSKRRRIRFFEDENGGYGPMAFSPSGQELAALIGYNVVRVWELPSWKVSAEFEIKESIPAIPDSESVIAFSRDGRALACGLADPGIALWDVATGRSLPGLTSTTGQITTLAFSHDGRRIYGGCTDTTTLCWNVPNLPPIAAPANSQIPELVRKLFGDDARAAREAKWLLSAAPKESVEEIRRRLGQIPSPDSKQVKKLVADLDDPKYATRAAAEQKLLALGHPIESELRKALEHSNSANQRAALVRLLERLDGPIKDANTLGSIRMIATLELIASPEAKSLLNQIASGAEDSLITRDASAALARLKSAAVSSK